VVCECNDIQLALFSPQEDVKVLLFRLLIISRCGRMKVKVNLAPDEILPLLLLRLT
jgi:hypothetical protein